jgi:hypothetical protein
MHILALIFGLIAIVIFGVEYAKTKALGWLGLAAFVAAVMANWYFVEHTIHSGA